jgi:putative toxin-antitoxin system antitoxin component (TIGR02293 family)
MEVRGMHAESVWSFVFPAIKKNQQPEPLELISLIRNGVPGDAIGKVAKVMMVPKTQLYNLLHISPRTAQRTFASHLDVEKSSHLVQIAKVYSRCLTIFKDPTKAVNWLQSPNYSLGDQSPLALLDTSEGIELVQDSLTRIEYGVFA